MHELSLCEAIADSVRAHAGGRPVAAVTVRVGALRQVVPDALTFAWTVLTDGTDLAACELQLELMPAVVACAGCGACTTLDVPVLACDACGSFDVMLQSGDELLIVSLALAEVS